MTEYIDIALNDLGFFSNFIAPSTFWVREFEPWTLGRAKVGSCTGKHRQIRGRCWLVNETKFQRISGNNLSTL